MLYVQTSIVVCKNTLLLSCLDKQEKCLSKDRYLPMTREHWVYGGVVLRVKCDLDFHFETNPRRRLQSNLDAILLY